MYVFLLFCSLISLSNPLSPSKVALKRTSSSQVWWVIFLQIDLAIWAMCHSTEQDYHSKAALSPVFYLAHWWPLNLGHSSYISSCSSSPSSLLSSDTKYWLLRDRDTLCTSLVSASFWGKTEKQDVGLALLLFLWWPSLQSIAIKYIHFLYSCIQVFVWRKLDDDGKNKCPINIDPRS